MTNTLDDHVPGGIDINPATGLPMMEDTCIDVGGSPYGYDVYQQPWEPSPSYDNNYFSGFDEW